MKFQPGETAKIRHKERKIAGLASIRLTCKNHKKIEGSAITDRLCKGLELDLLDLS